MQNKYCKKIEAWGKFDADRWYTDHFVLLRPTGNPVNLKEYQKMIQEDIVVESHKLVSIDLISIVSHDTAIVHATHEER